MKRLKTLLLALLLTITAFTTLKAAESYDSLDIIKDVQLEVKRDSTTEIIGSETIISAVDTLIIEFKFELDDAINYQNKITTFVLPSIFDPAKTVESLDIYSGSELIARITREPGTLNMTMTFTDSDFLVNNSNIKGAMRLLTQTDRTQITSQEKYPIYFEGLGNFEVEIVPPNPDGEPEIAYAWKGGQLTADKSNVGWSIYITAFQDLENLVIRDQHLGGQEIDTDSFEISIASYYVGDVVMYEPLDVTPEFDGNGGFTIDIGTVYYDGKLNGGPAISSEVHEQKRDGVRVRYKTKITEEQDTYDNKVEFSATQLGSDVRDMTSVVYSGGGAIAGETRSIVILKVDGDTNAALIGARFNIEKYNPTSQTWSLYRSNLDVESVNGLQVDLMTFGTYRLVETQAPDGYMLDETPFDPFVIDATIVEGTPFEVIVKNFKRVPVQNPVSIHKVASHNQEGLAGAEFVLQDADDTVIYTFPITDDQGHSMLEDVVAGTYKLVETQAPTGYTSRGYIKNVTVVDGVVLETITVENTKIVPPTVVVPEIEVPTPASPEVPTPVSPKLPSTGVNNVLIVGGLSVLALGLGLVLVQRYRKYEK
ncbi:LPXTG cell wall anchor domain-containing protein [Erysipelothrix sp. HDW6C]|uniref:SpaA isopeptide-forming pilin-related protein n=1 Tax=Erysipelothrix sp. HDW6C TaxID=2714930 RepID=UPI001407EAD0|nr:SpaA isopeptide-forming pilin-related protein [Erysipelothrix sp. HDW6C]QIK69233.1 LPXTG cell wall anchor domain-containing protein [Erysipelothrix sp. HDW6C]